jgi:hypothetical protein
MIHGAQKYPGSADFNKSVKLSRTSMLMNFGKDK